MDERTKLAALKKADIHIHFEGSVGHATLSKLSAKNKIDLLAPISISGFLTHPPTELREHYPKHIDFGTFIAIYLKITECIEDEKDVMLIATDYLEAAARENIVYSEIYFSPTTHALLGKKLEPIFDGLKEAQELARRKYKHRIRYIFDIVRNADLAGEETIAHALEARKRGVDVFAIGLAGYEAKKGARAFRDDFKRAKALGFETLAHAGETLGAEGIWETIRELEVKRIGHGVRAIENPKLLEYLAKNEIVLEICPWSNVYLNIFKKEEHPIKKLHDLGIKIVIASDDPGIFQKNLTDNYIFALEAGMTTSDLEKIALRSLTKSLDS